MEKLPKSCGSVPANVELTAQKQYFWCSCGLSAKQPFCDGAHKQSGTFKSVPFSVPKDTTAKLCLCKKTATPPYCDGSHNLPG